MRYKHILAGLCFGYLLASVIDNASLWMFSRPPARQPLVEWRPAELSPPCVNIGVHVVIERGFGIYPTLNVPCDSNQFTITTGGGTWGTIALPTVETGKARWLCWVDDPLVRVEVEDGSHVLLIRAHHDGSPAPAWTPGDRVTGNCVVAEY